MRKGQIYDEPEHNVRFQEWRYKIEGRVTGGEWLKLIFTFTERHGGFIVTAFVDKTK
jgi:hypothetical protein